MESQSEQFEREAEETRWQLAGTFEELRDRMTPGRVVDQVVDYTRDGPAAEFLRNLKREVRENPMPLVLIGIGIAWLMVASSRPSGLKRGWHSHDTPPDSSSALPPPMGIL